MRLALDKITVGVRHRRNLGDLDALARSMDEIGLLHPVVVTRGSRVLVAGERRLRAAALLGWTAIEVREVDLEDPLRAERDENEQRKPLTKSEAVAVARAIEQREKVKARERQLAGKRPSGDFPEGQTGEAKAIAAAAVGMDRKTLAKAAEVVEAAEADPEQFGDLAEQMDATGKVEPAHRELQERVNGSGDPEALEESPCPSCGRWTPRWVLGYSPEPEGAAWRWKDQIGQPLRRRRKK